MGQSTEIVPNIDLASGTVQDALGFPREDFTAMFIAARTPWIDHVMEQYADDRRVRPTPEGTGALGKACVSSRDR